MNQDLQENSKFSTSPKNLKRDGGTDVLDSADPSTGSAFVGHYSPATSLQKAKRKLRSNVSRDEMNLAEFPLAVLSTRVDSKIKTLEFTDYTRGPKGEMVERRWIITGADKFGLPTATDDDVVLGLIRLSMDQDFRQPKVYFTRYELLKTLRWSTEGRSYQRLVKSLDRLSGVRIRSSNSFYDNATKSYQTSNFGIIDAYEINDERAGGEKNSFFIWSEMLFDSFKSGYIKKLDLDLYFSLKSAVARRLYRYLDKHFYFKNVLDAHLFTLAFEKIGLSRSYKYVSSIRQQLTPALKELVEIGFLSSYEFLGEGQNSIIRFVAVNGTTSVRPQKTFDAAADTGEGRAKKVSGAIHVRKKTEDQSHTIQQSFHDYQTGTRSRAEANSTKGIDQTLVQEITNLLVDRGIMERQIPKLLSSQGAESLRKVRKIIDFYDELCARADKRVSINPVGFLYRAVESPYKITLPDERKVQKEIPLSKRPEHRIFKAEKRSGTAKQKTPVANTSSSSQIPSSDPRRTHYRSWIENELTCIMTRMAPVELGELFAETENKMKSLKRILSTDRFQEAVEGCVRDELKRRFHLPSFEKWIEKNK
jgi:hypothetical protein